MIDKALRIPKEHLLVPVAEATRAVSPTAVTLSAFAVGLVSVGCILLEAYALGLGLWLLNRLLDGLDGTSARVQNRQSDLGGYLDMLSDMVLYAAVPVAFAVPQPATGTFVALALLLGSCYLNAGAWMYLAAILEKRGVGATTRGEQTSVTMPSGLVEGAETVLFYTLFFLLPGSLTLLFLVFAVLVLVTAAQRLAWAVRTLG